MAVEEFSGSDADYLRWVRAHPQGFVLTTARGVSRDYMSVHAARCQMISEYLRPARPGAFTERRYMKVCALDGGELLDWIARHDGLHAMKLCSRCAPSLPDRARPPVAGRVRLPPDAEVPLADEVPAAMWEGARQTVEVNRFERSREARAACLAHHGHACTVCGMDFASRYGEEFAGFIHVHHLVPLSRTDAAYQVDPENDLIPVCPNCHAALHHGGELRSLAALRMMMIEQEEPD